MATGPTALLAIGLALASGAPVKPPIKRQEHPLVRPVCGALAACTAEAMTMPIDIAKVPPPAVSAL